MKSTAFGARVIPLIAAMAIGLQGCGGGPTHVDPPPPPPKPAATLTAVGAGALVLHPSLDARFGLALETPIRIVENAGGTADWNFARISYFLGGKEVERFELGADTIQRLGFSRIAASSNKVYTVIFRFNSDDFDRIDVTLGFGDVKDGRQFTVDVPFGSFSGVNISLTPMSMPAEGMIRLDP
jgi:hypothetical protein